jgi:hypothetical protein
MIAYFDTQAFNRIYGKIGCTGADIANLRKAIYGRQLSIRPSLHTLEEILLGRKVSPQAYAAQIKLTLSLASARALIKPCHQLLLDDIRSYAARGEAERPFLHGDVQNIVADGIAALIESDGEDLDEDFVGVLEDARKQKQEFQALIEHMFDELAAAYPMSERSGGPWDLDRIAAPAVEQLARGAGALDGCRQRGIDGVLKMKSVRMTFGVVLTGIREKPASSAAMHHAVSAAAVAETFVSDDAGNHELLARVPLNGLTISRLSDFLAHLA